MWWMSGSERIPFAPLLLYSPQFPYYYLFIALFFWIPLSFSAFYSPLWNKHEKLLKVSKHELLQWSHIKKRVNEAPKRISGTVFWGGGIRREAIYCQRHNHWADLGVSESEIRLVLLVFANFRGNPFLPLAAWESKFIIQVMPILCIKPQTWAPAYPVAPLIQSVSFRPSMWFLCAYVQ